MIELPGATVSSLKAVAGRGHLLLAAAPIREAGEPLNRERQRDCEKYQEPKSPHIEPDPSRLAELGQLDFAPQVPLCVRQARSLGPERAGRVRDRVSGLGMLVEKGTPLGGY